MGALREGMLKLAGHSSLASLRVVADPFGPPQGRSGLTAVLRSRLFWLVVVGVLLVAGVAVWPLLLW